MERYIEYLTSYLINKEAFQPVSDEWKRGEHLDAGVILGRRHWGNWNLVRILPADSLEEKDIEQFVGGEETKLHNLQHETRSSGVVGIIILVYSRGVTQSRREWLLSLQKKAFWQNNYTLTWIVDLLDGKVWKHQGRPWRTFLSPELLAGIISGHDEFFSYEDTRGAEKSQGVEDSGGNENSGGHSRNPQALVTTAILVVNILVWLLMEVIGGSRGGSESTDVLVEFGAKYTSKIIEGEYWRLFTSMFLHIGIAHLVFNSFALYQLGTGVEYLYGSKKFSLIYVLAGLWGSVASFLFSPNISAGASGAIFGLFGALLYFGRREPKIFARGLGSGILVALVVNLVFGLLNPRIDNYAHVGGLLGGYLTSSAIGLKGENPWKFFRTVQLLIILLLLVGLFVYGLLKVGGGLSANI